MGNLTIHLVYKSESPLFGMCVGRSLIAAKVNDIDLIKQVAKKAISQAYKDAEIAMPLDDFVGKVKFEEAERLMRVLKTLIPDLEDK